MSFLLVVVVGLAFLLVSLPHAVVPPDFPGLPLDPRAVAAQLADDARRAATVPANDRVFRVEQLWLVQGEAEIVANEPQDAVERRTRAMAEALYAVRSRDGEDATRALRARAAERVVDALRGQLSDVDSAHYVGRFAKMLERYGLVAENRVVAPILAVRTLFKARWNAAYGLPLTQGLSPVELQAYWGWLAVGSSGTPVATRLEALDAYAHAGGRSVAELRGSIAFAAGNGDLASTSYLQAFEESGCSRLRNHAIAAQALAQTAPEE